MRARLCLASPPQEVAVCRGRRESLALTTFDRSTRSPRSRRSRCRCQFDSRPHSQRCCCNNRACSLFQVFISYMNRFFQASICRIIEFWRKNWPFFPPNSKKFQNSLVYVGQNCKIPQFTQDVFLSLQEQSWVLKESSRDRRRKYPNTPGFF